MSLIRYRPGPPLDAFVACFWWSRRDRPDPHTEHMLPSGNAQLIFALHDASFACSPSSTSDDPLVWTRGIVHGPQWGYYRAGPKPGGAVVGVAFRPGMAGPVLGMPAAELAGRHVPLDALWGPRGGEVRERLLDAGDPAEVFRVLERDLTTRIERSLLMHPAVAAALAQGRRRSWVADAHRDSGYSARHFIALFRAAVGLTPKHYDRLQRFNTVLRSLATGGVDDLAGLAVSAGYADQSHLTREFRDFAGVTPTRYRPAGADRTQHHRPLAVTPRPAIR